MLQKSIFSLIFLFSFYWANAYDIKGNVSGLGKPLSNVSVYIHELKRGVATDQQGNYVIKNVPEGSYLIEFSHIGYQSQAITLQVSQHAELNVALLEAVVEKDAVVVTGVSQGTRLRSMPLQVDMMRKAALQKMGSSNLVQALANRPGIDMFSTGPAIAKPVIRGLSYNRVLVLHDGIRQEGQQWGDEHGLEIDMNAVEKVEVLKGPASLIYGSDAMGGVINIITQPNIPLHSFKGDISTGYETNSRLLQAGIVAGENKGKWVWQLDADARKSGDYHNPADGYVFNSKFRQYNLGLFAGINSQKGFTHFSAGRYVMHAGLTEGERNDAGQFLAATAAGEVVATDDMFKTSKPYFPKQVITHSRFMVDNSYAVGRHRLSFNAGWQRNEREELANPADPSERELFFDLQSILFNARWLLKENNGWNTSLGINTMLQSNKNKGVEQIIPNYTQQDVGLFLYSRKTWGITTFSGGIRADNRYRKAEDLMEDDQVKNPGFSKNYFNLAGGIGASMELRKNLILKWNTARSFRTPSLPEIASNGVHEGTFRYEIGNPNLKTEKGWQNDLSIEWENEHLNVSLAGYYNAFKDFIYYTKLSNSTGGDSLIDQTPVFVFTQGDANIRGLEFSFDLHPHPVHWLHFENTFSLVLGSFAKPVAGSSYLPNMPAPRWRSELRADVPNQTNAKWSERYIFFAGDYTGAQSRYFSAYNTETYTPGYLLFNAGLGGTLLNKAKKPIVNIKLFAFNITNKSYQSHLSRLKYLPENPATGKSGVFNAGRNFSIQLNFPISMGLN